MLAFSPCRVATATIFLALLFICAAAKKPGPLTKQKDQFQISQLFDFEHYKKMFEKKYSGTAEELVRRKLFLAKAFRALVSGVSYKFRKSSYYLALNPLSDRTKKEVDSTHLSPESLEDFGTSHIVKPPSNATDLLVESMADIRVGIDNLKAIAAEKNETRIVNELNRMQGLVSTSRQKRSTRRGIRQNFSFEQIFVRSVKVKLPPAAEAKLDRNPKSNNPNYEPPDISSSGYKSQFKFIGRQFKKTMNNLLGTNPKHSHHKRGVHILQGMSNQPSDWAGSYQKHYDYDADRVYIDHSKNGCMYAPGHQRSCGSCYAFAVSGYFEWLYCKKKGRLIPFSEQYIVDCGPVFLGHGIYGCKGGHLTVTAQFFQNYGAELSTKYPYIGLEGNCPYNLESKDKMGFFRFHSTASRYVQVPLTSFNYYLNSGPMVLTILTDGDFGEYGGGVHSAEYCCVSKHCNPHAVVLIGHGREDGEEYWLFKNSYSSAWGVDGYYKMSKKADCIRANVGLMFGTRDGINFELEASSKGPLPPF